VAFVDFVPDHSGGTATDLHRVPDYAMNICNLFIDLFLTYLAFLCQEKIFDKKLLRILFSCIVKPVYGR